MVLQAAMIIVDNSESSRNGDYMPTRFQAQYDAVHLLTTRITDDNPESTVGLMSMGNESPTLETPLTGNKGRGEILKGLSGLKIGGNSHLSQSIQIAMLALKHRGSSTLRQRIVVFICSPISEDTNTLVSLAKKTRKSSVAVDFVAFGELNDDTLTKLQAFHQNVGSSEGGAAEGSHLEVVPPGPNLLSDSLIGTPIFGLEPGMGGAGAGGEGGEDFEFGIDPSADPELAFALRMSLEEEKARIERENKEGQNAEGSRMEGIEEEGKPSEEGEGGEGKPLLDRKQEDGDGKDKDGDDHKMDMA